MKKTKPDTVIASVAGRFRLDLDLARKQLRLSRDDAPIASFPYAEIHDLLLVADTMDEQYFQHVTAEG